MTLSNVTAGDGTRIHVKDWGTGPPVVLIHGWPLSADSWVPSDRKCRLQFLGKA